MHEDFGDNLLAGFNHKLSSVVETRRELDHFDLHSADVASCIHYRLLQRVYVTQAMELIEMIEANPREIREQLLLVLRDS